MSGPNTGRKRVPRAALAAALSLLAACAAASGYDPKRYEGSAKPVPADPDTEPLPPAPKTKIPDPKGPVAVSAGREPLDAGTASPALASSTNPAAKNPKAPAPTPTAAASAATGTPAEADCGTKDNPCPMQKLMRGPMTAAQTAEALETAFTKVAALSPNAGWAWTPIAKKGAELAKAGDVAGAKGQCKACHEAYKDAYKKQYRAKKL